MALKNLPVELVEHAPPEGGVTSASILRINPQGQVPVLETDQGTRMSQSLAILEWLDEMWPSPPLLPPSPEHRAQVRAFSQVIASDMQPLLALRSMGRLRRFGMEEQPLRLWARAVLSEGLDACEALLNGADGPFCFGAAPGLADVCLVPQLAMARAHGLALTFPRLLAAEAACMTLPAFRDTRPPEL